MNNHNRELGRCFLKGILIALFVGGLLLMTLCALEVRAGSLTFFGVLLY